MPSEPARDIVIPGSVALPTGASAQLQAGCEEAAKEIGQKYGNHVSCALIGVPNPDASTQIGQITSGLNAHQ